MLRILLLLLALISAILAVILEMPWVLGLAGAWFLARLLQGLIFGVDVRDPVTFVAVPLVLAAISLVAAWYPAFRAGRSDPVQVLRSD